MTIIERICDVIEQKNLKTADLAKKLGIRHSVITNWKKRNTNPPIEYILHICEFLDISVDELITGESGDTLTPEEQALLAAYRRSDERGKRNIMKEALYEAEQGKSSTSENGREVG